MSWKLKHGNYNLAIGWMYYMCYPPILHQCPGPAGATRAGGGSDKPSVLVKWVK